MSEHIEWLKAEFDKAMIALLAFLCIIGAIHAAHHNPPDSALVTWLQLTASNLIGALLTLITGAVLKGKNGNSGGAPPAPSGTGVLPVVEHGQDAHATERKAP